MLATLKQVNKLSVKRFDLFALSTYTVGVFIALMAIFMLQSQRVDEIANVNLANVFPYYLIEMHSLTDNSVSYQVSLSTPLLTRTIEHQASQQVFVLIHPIWLLFSSLYFVALSLLYGGLVVLIRLRLVKENAKALAHISAIERWAYLTDIQGKAPPIQGDGAIALAIKKLMEQVKDASSKQAQIDQIIREQALLDSETGIGNREFFSNRLDALLYEEDVRGAVVLVHLKELEVVQTMYGDEYALDILSSIIALIKSRLTRFNGYFIARRSEFEIAILLSGVFVDEAEKFAGQLISSLTNIEYPVGINSEESCHIGVSCFSKKQQSYQIMAEADMALRSAQLQGPNQWFMYDTGEVAQESAKGSLKWRTFLTQAIEKNAFVIFFQPVISSDNVADGENERILHHEVLSKVRDKKGKLISARVFLPMAQKCGLSAQVDALVVEQVCRLLQYERKQKDACSLNLSIDALLNEKFQNMLFGKLANMPDIAKRLIVEISEYHLVTHINKLTPVLIRLTELGVKLLADKVGQYVVSTDYLRECPISYVKLHRSLVHQIHEKLENQIYIQSLKTRCQQYQVSIYALGVEHKQEWQTLMRLGVTGGQGHFFTEPVAQMANAIELN